MKRKLRSEQFIAGHEVVFSNPFSLESRKETLLKGIIFGIQAEADLEELASAAGAIKAERITKRFGGNIVKTPRKITAILHTHI